MAEEAPGAPLAVKRLVRVGVPFKEILYAVEAEKIFRRCPVALVSVRSEAHFRHPA